MDDVKIAVQVAVLFFIGLGVLEMILSKKRKQMNKRTTITFKDEGEIHVQRALSRLRGAQRTAKANKS